MSCIFCKIVAGEIPSLRVHEDERVFAFLDINPLRRGHLLVIPREHQALFEELPAETQAAMAVVAARLSKAAREVVGAPASTLAINNGRSAGQEVPHCHLHVVPRPEADGAGGVHALFHADGSTSDDLEATAQAVQQALGA